MAENRYFSDQTAENSEREATESSGADRRSLFKTAYECAGHPARLAVLGSGGWTWVHSSLASRAGWSSRAGRRDRPQPALPNRADAAER